MASDKTGQPVKVRHDRIMSDEGTLRVGQHFDNKEFKILSTMRLSAWENSYHVLEPDGRREVTLLTLKKDKYVKQLEEMIEASDEWDSEEEIPPKAHQKFEEINRQFKERHERAMAIPAHRCLPKVFSVFLDIWSEQYFAMMEYAAGVPFLVAASSLTPLQNLGLIRELLDGLGPMHNQGLLHRRIKSKNIFVRFEGMKPVAKFSTWGLAIPIEEAQGDRSGAVDYTAPEVLSKGGITKQTDLWAIGSLLYQALTNEPPFPERHAARNIDELARIAKRESLPNSLTTYGFFQNIPPRQNENLKIEKLDELLMELLKHNPEERKYKSARAVINFIEANWPELREGAPEQSSSMTLSVGRKDGDS